MGAAQLDDHNNLNNHNNHGNIVDGYGNAHGGEGITLVRRCRLTVSNPH